MTTTSRKPTARRRDHEPLAKAILIEGESPDHFYALLDRLATELQPANFIEWQIISPSAMAQSRLFLAQVPGGRQNRYAFDDLPEVAAEMFKVARQQMSRVRRNRRLQNRLVFRRKMHPIG